MNITPGYWRNGKGEKVRVLVTDFPDKSYPVLAYRLYANTGGVLDDYPNPNYLYFTAHGKFRAAGTPDTMDLIAPWEEEPTYGSCSGCGIKSKAEILPMNWRCPDCRSKESHARAALPFIPREADGKCTMCGSVGCPVCWNRQRKPQKVKRWLWARKDINQEYPYLYGMALLTEFEAMQAAQDYVKDGDLLIRIPGTEIETLIEERQK